MHALQRAWQTLEHDFDAACAEAGRSARRQITRDLNQVVRRLRQYEDEDQWVGALRDGISKAADQFAIFTVKDGLVSLRSEQGLALPDGYPEPLSSLLAFAAAVESREAVVSLRTTREVGQRLATEPETARAHILPIANSGRVVALLFVPESDALDVNAIELVAGIAAVVLERRSNLALHSQIAPALAHAGQLESEPGPETQEGAEQRSAGSPKRSLPPWSALSEGQRELHTKAQRFSRNAVAQMQLTRPGACRAGREQKDVYMFLQAEIDKARETYRKQFMTIPSMVDYLHLELVRTATDGDETALGADYPGRLV